MPRRKPPVTEEAAILWMSHERLVYDRARHWSPSAGEPCDDLVSAAKAEFFRDWVHRFDPKRAKMSTYLYRVVTNMFNKMRLRRRDALPLEGQAEPSSPLPRKSMIRQFESCSPVTLNILAFIFEYYEDIFTEPVHSRRRLGILRDHLLAVEYTEEELNTAFREIRRVLRHVH